MIRKTRGKKKDEKVTLGSFVVNLIPKGRERLGHHFHQVKSRALSIVLPLKLVEETLKRPAVTLQVDNQPSGPEKQDLSSPTLHRMKPTSRMTAIRSFRSGIDSFD